MIKFDSYYYRDEEAPRLLVSLDWFKYEDHWFQRWMFDHPMWKEDDMERIRLVNLARCQWFKIALNLFHYKISIDIKLKHVGNLYHGRDMKDEPHVPEFVKRNRERKKNDDTGSVPTD